MKPRLSAIINKRLNNDLSIIVISCALFLLIEIPTLTNGRPLINDEAWYSNSAYSLLQGHWIRNTNVGSGGDLNFVFPLIQGILFTFFGFSVFMARFTSVLAGVFSLAVLFKLLKQLKLPNNAIIFSLFALIAIPVYHSAFRYARPESWAILFVLLALFFLIKHIGRSDNTCKDALSTGVFCGIGFLTHPFTLSVSLAIGLVLIVHCLKTKRPMPLFVFVTPLVLAVAIFFINCAYVLGTAKPDLVFERINTGDIRYLSSICDNLKSVADFYILNKNISYSASLFFALVLGLFMRKKSPQAFYSSLMAVFVFLASMILFSSNAFFMLMAYVFIFAILNITFIANAITNKITLVGIFCYLLFMLLAYFSYDARKYETVNSSLKTQLRSIIPENAKVMGPTRFWMFIPNTRFISTAYRWNYAIDMKKLPAEFDYFLAFSEDETNIFQNIYDINRTFKQYPGAKLAHVMNSKTYGRIELYSIRKIE